jgi:hypothetical protein
MRKLIKIILIFIAIAGASFAIYRDYITSRNFCSYNIDGRIDSIKVGIRGYYSIKVNNEWYHLHNFALNEISNLAIGDSVIKKKDCYKVYLIKDGRTYNMSIEGQLPCNCD